jgi:hypothetical protein
MCNSGKGHQFPLFGWGLTGLTVRDRILGGFPARNTVYTPYIYLANPTYMYTVYARMYGSSPARNTVHTLYIRVYVWFGQNHKCTPYVTVHLAVSLPGMPYTHRIYRVGQSHTYIRIYGVYTVF